jgi:two-component system, chemotaxis family, chemotaxis protein CheY
VTTGFDKIRFLHVDDNAHMLNIVKTMLRGFGAVHLFEARNSKDALERLRNDAIDIVLLDYVIGEEDGVEFLRRVRRDPGSPAPFVPVIMLTAQSERARVEAARDAGVSEFCTKPITAADLLRKLQGVIDHPRAFIRSDGYAGPDRRRRDNPDYKGPERRKDR